MRFVKTLFATVVVGGMAVGAAANAQTYQCVISKVSPKSNWIAPNITFRFDSKGGVTVMDSKIQDFGGGAPLAASAKKRSNGKLVISWKLSKIKTNIKTRQPLRLYTAEVTPGSLGLTVYAKQAGAPFRIRGRGQCTQRK